MKHARMPSGLLLDARGGRPDNPRRRHTDQLPFGGMKCAGRLLAVFGPPRYHFDQRTSGFEKGETIFRHPDDVEAGT